MRQLIPINQLMCSDVSSAHAAAARLTQRRGPAACTHALKGRSIPGYCSFQRCSRAIAGADSGAGFDSSGYGAFADEDAGPAEQEDGRRRQILDAALQHVVRQCSAVLGSARQCSAAVLGSARQCSAVLARQCSAALAEGHCIPQSHMKNGKTGLTSGSGTHCAAGQRIYLHR